MFDGSAQHSRAGQAFRVDLLPGVDDVVDVAQVPLGQIDRSGCVVSSVAVGGEHHGRVDWFVVANAEEGLNVRYQRQGLEDPTGEHAQREARPTVGRTVQHL